MGCCEVTKYFEKYSCFICLFTNNFLFKQSTLWYIKIIKALHVLCQTIDYAIAFSFKNYLQFRMALMYKPTTWKIKKCSIIYKSLLKELSLVELKVG